MKKPTDKDLTRLADAAFRQAARKVIARAEASVTPIIVYMNEEVMAMVPKTVDNGKRPRLTRSRVRRDDK